MTTAEERGWGDCGVPDPDRQRAYARAHVVTASIAGVSWRVHRKVEPIFRVLLERHVVPRIGPITRVADDWSYAPRCVRGTGPGTGKPCVISNHAWGLAIDVNATENVMGGADRDGQFPADFGDEIAYLGLRWGGDYTSRTDPMHFEFLGTPEEADMIVARIERGAVLEDDDMDEATVERIVRKVLNEGTARGQTTWAGTSKATLGQAQGNGNELRKLAAEVTGLREDVAALQAGGGAVDPVALAREVVDELHRRTES